ncbi:MAG TPA: type II secretion system protein [Thermoanaerobaculales bacterium]|nr:type II secretion system protein [Thermoanaerobaculales bacterium]HPA81710.1 type II secretion system protein [Thermoanaerobaculales bacterium]HQL31180.1 type II secretion system protein [Thermoanaerobaculales bacterium]HQN95963.1 type II secretion system protein [Thermoanaerobaculales bacterium]HQP43535.1 type II secretion system protein [Thermoanaerobaculales bacterium]
MIRHLHRRRSERGFTLAELVMVAALIAVLSTMALPVAKFTVKRRKEAELRLALRLMRNAIDEHKRLSDQGLIPLTLGGEGYPEDLDVLVEGVDLVGQETKRRFLRRIPWDPMTGEQEWGKRSYQDDPDSDSWGSENLYDVYSLSDGTAIDGTKYKDW